MITVYRVQVTAWPAGSDDPDWRPERVIPFPNVDGSPRAFTWPRQRNFFSSASANRRAQLFRELGAEAHVESARVAFPSDLAVAK